MNQSYPEYWPQYFTATIYEWKHLLLVNAHKSIIVNCLKFMVNESWIILNAFVIMSNHFHCIWQPQLGFTPSGIQASFLKYTAQQFKRLLWIDNTNFLEEFRVNKYDRKYQFWIREPLSVELRTSSVFFQKLDYIHYNLVKAGLCKYPEEYYYSSARFYHLGADHFDMLTHYSDK